MEYDNLNYNPSVESFIIFIVKFYINDIFVTFLEMNVLELSEKLIET